MKSLPFAALGFCAVLAQTIYVREILALFTGTELVIGAILAAWLCWIGAGGIIGGRLLGRRPVDSGGMFRRLTVSIALLVPATTIAIRIGRAVLVRPPGALPPLLPALAFSLLAMAPFGLLFGTVYNAASALAARRGEGIDLGVSRVYIWEAVGSLAAGALFAFILIPRLSQLETACVAAIAVSVAAMLASDGGAAALRRAGVAAALGIVLLFAAQRIDRASIEAVYPGYRIERFLSSRYGEIVVASREEVVSFFSSGARLFSMPEPERAEESVHLPLLAHPDPRRVLLIGGSLGGGWQEAAKHPSIETIDCIELDGALIELALAFNETRARDAPRAPGRGASGVDSASGGAPGGVRFVTGDGRFYLAANERPYDVIVLSSPPPLTMQWNRYYTVAFFTLARDNLAPGGLFAISHPSSENFITRDQARVLASIRSTLSAAFEDVTVLPGPTVHFIGGIGEIDAETLLARLDERGVETRYISAGFLPYRFADERRRYLASALDGAPAAAVNADVRPVLPLYELILEGRRMKLAGAGLLEALLRIPAFGPPVVVLGVFLLLFARARRLGAARLSVMTVGMGSFLFQIMVLLGYQAYSGHLYHAIVLLTGLFMAGAAAGASISLRRSSPRRMDIYLVHLCFVILAVLLCAASMRGVHAGRGQTVAGSSFYLFSTACGVLTGAYYPLVVRRALRAERRSVPAVFYSWDLFGAALGGFLGGVVFFPITGVVGTTVFIAALHALAAAILVGKW